MSDLNIQPDAIRIAEDNYDTLELLDIDDHLVLIQVSESGEAETLVIGPGQQERLLEVLQKLKEGRR